MRVTRAALALLVVAVGVALVLESRRDPTREAPPTEPLEPVAESPRPPVAAEPPAAALAPMPVSLRRAAEPRSRQTAVADRNERVREHRRLVEAYRAGMVSIQEVEAAEMRLLDARHELGEIDVAAWHRARVVLLERAVERTQARVDAGLVPADEAGRARLALDLERFLAGEAVDYEARRASFLAASRDRQRARVEFGLLTAEDARVEGDRLEAEFPTADAAKAADR